MISYSNIRRNGYDELPEVARPRPVIDAMWTLLYYELGYGGRIVKIDKTTIVTVTSIFASVDTTTFTGPEKEMEVLLRAAALHFKFLPKPGDMYDLLKKTIGERAASNPLMISSSIGMVQSGLLQGGGRQRAIAIDAVGVEDLELAKKLYDLKEEKKGDHKNLLAVLELYYEGGDLTNLLEMVA